MGKMSVYWMLKRMSQRGKQAETDHRLPVKEVREEPAVLRKSWALVMTGFFATSCQEKEGKWVCKYNAGDKHVLMVPVLISEGDKVM